MYMYTYIYVIICIYVSFGLAELLSAYIPVSVNKNTPPEKNTRWNISFQSTESGAGEQFSAAGPQCRGSREGSALLMNTGEHRYGFRSPGSQPAQSAEPDELSRLSGPTY